MEKEASPERAALREGTLLGKSDTRLLPYVQCGADGPTPFFASSVLVFGEVFPDRSVPGGAPFNVACHLAAFGEKFFFDQPHRSGSAAVPWHPALIWH